MIPPVTEAYVRGLVEVGAGITGVTVEEVMGPSRARPAWMVRAAVGVVLRERGWGYERIGEALGKHHSTLVHHVEGHASRMSDDEYRYLFEQIKCSERFPDPGARVADLVKQLDHLIAAAQEARAELLATAVPRRAS